MKSIKLTNIRLVEPQPFESYAASAFKGLMFAPGETLYCLPPSREYIGTDENGLNIAFCLENNFIEEKNLGAGVSGEFFYDAGFIGSVLRKGMINVGGKEEFIKSYVISKK